MRQTFKIAEDEMLLLYDCDVALLIHCVDVDAVVDDTAMTLCRR